jgi:hypothetical protein
MAFLPPPPASSGEDRLPILAYNAKAGRMFLQDRKQDANGEWHTEKVDVTMQQPPFAVDFGRLEVGWSFFAEGQAPLWSMVPYGQPLPAQPASPGLDAEGKAQRFRQAFRVPVCGSAIGGVREMAGNSGAMITGMNELHTQYEAAQEARQGMLPLVKLVNVIPVKVGRSENFQPVFQIVQWVPRPDALLGARTVPPPSGAVPAAQPVQAAPVAPTPAPVVQPPPSPPAQSAAVPDAMPF